MLKQIYIVVAGVLLFISGAQAGSIEYLTQERLLSNEAQNFFPEHPPSIPDSCYSIRTVNGVSGGRQAADEIADGKCSSSSGSAVTGAYDARLRTGSEWLYYDYGLVTVISADARQQSSLGADSITFVAEASTRGEVWGDIAARSFLETTFSLDSATTFRIAGVLGGYGFAGGSCLVLAGCLDFQLATADGATTFLDTSNFLFTNLATTPGVDPGLITWLNQTDACITIGGCNSRARYVDATITLGPGSYRFLADVNVARYDRSGDYEAESFGIMNVQMSVVPVPPALVLFPSALALLGWVRSRRSARNG